MTSNQQINLAISIPFTIAAFSIFEINILIFALLSTMITGILQIIIAVSLLNYHYKNKHLQVYFFACILFFSLWFFTNWDWIWVMPVILAIYMTLIVHFIIVEEEYESNYYD